MATDAEPLILSAQEVATAPPEVRDYLSKLQQRRRDRVPRTKSVQLVSRPNVEVGPPSLPSGGPSTHLEAETDVATLVAKLLLFVQSGGVGRDELENVVKELLAGLAAPSARSQEEAPNLAPTSVLTPGEPTQLPPTPKLGQQTVTTGHAPNDISVEPAANQSSTEGVPAAGPVQLGVETKPTNAPELEPIDVDMFPYDRTDTPKALPELAGSDPEQLETLVAWGEKHWPKRGLDTFRPNQLLLIELAGTSFGPSLRPKWGDKKSGAVLLHNVNNGDQLSANDKDHWVISITDWTQKTFTAYGMQPRMFTATKATHEAEFGSLKGTSHELGPFVADNCCAFQCCNALRCYLGKDPERPDGPWTSLRLLYLKRLLGDWVRQDDSAVLSPPVSAQQTDHAINGAFAASISVTSGPADTDGASSVAASSPLSSVPDPFDEQRNPPKTPTTESPSIEEWSEFGSLYDRIRDSHGQHGFALINVPGSPSYAATVKPEISKSYRQSFRRNPELGTVIQLLDPRLTKHNPRTACQIESNPGGSPDARTAFDRWWQTFGSGTDYLPPQYATDIDVPIDSEERQRCGLLESPIYPLDGNVLLDSAPETGGLTLPQAYLSFGFGTIFTAHTEEFDAPAINFLHYGHDKLWVVIPPIQREKLESALEREGLAHRKRRSCHQYIRHQRLFLHLKFLEANDIKYTCFLQTPGTAVLLLPGATHFGFNLGQNAAEAVNYVPRNWKPPADYVVCRCYPWDPITRDMLCRPPTSRTGAPPSKPGKNGRSKRKIVETHDDTETRPRKAHCREWEVIKKELLRVDGSFKIPSFNRGDDLPADNILKLAAVIQSRSAIYQFCDLVRSWRQPNNTRIRFNNSGDVYSRMNEHMQGMQTGESRAIFNKLLVRYYLFRFAEDLDGRLRLDTKMKNSLMEKLQVKGKTLERRIHAGKQWRDICRGYSGLLCFIFLGNNPFEISETAYLEMTPKAVTEFHLLMDDKLKSRLHEAGSAFLKSLDCTAEPVEFRWETEVDLKNLKDDDLLECLESRLIPREDCYNPAQYPDWSKPPDWPWSWPANPTLVPKNEKQCELCDQTSCDCVNNLPTPKPRIIYLGQKGRGLQAVADSPGQVAYEARVIIGYLFGKIEPLGTYNDDRAMDLVRADITGEPKVCQISYAEVGNCFRLLNHSCQPVARLQGMKVSGRYRTAVVAVTDIYDGTEITVSYGRGSKPRPCLCGRC
ncbi:hypothetical protein CONLIGDRAFT_636078 [Coniochaeta ligniaria NRRL 30616]|uniref:JmjC domain-containing protein n=1 Tax=Coniochaeta ligniaria NRRL 30616 TaxID=1408157 RepID=A0A1J7IV20_9PEZI|nr:hypothetical protein CONLIGDRAFT_636078 [Coniochaeta ligniaria NRRL 30616]